MDAIASIPFFGGFLSTVLPFVVVLGIVVFVHEYGHYIVARWCGIKSEVFSIGFGPVIWSRRDRRGTLWQVAALPLGGYVKFKGDSDGASRSDPEALARMSREERRTSFHGASVGRRMLTVLAGPFFNFLLTIAIFAGMALWQGVPTERPTVGEIEALPGVEQPLAAWATSSLAVNGRRGGGLRGSLPRGAGDEPAGADAGQRRPGRRDAGSDRALSAAAEGAGCRAAVAGQRRRAEGGRPGADGRRASRSPRSSDLRAVVLASGGRTIPLDGLARRRRRWRSQITPKERDSRRRRGRLRAAGDDRGRGRAALPAGHGDARGR